MAYRERRSHVLRTTEKYLNAVDGQKSGFSEIEAGGNKGTPQIGMVKCTEAACFYLPRYFVCEFLWIYIYSLYIYT